MIMPGSMQPTVVLVHGAFADASGFGGVIRELATSGYEVVAPPNPLRSLAFDANAVGAYVRAIDGPVVLVGHSYGGAVITQASADLGNVVGLVYVAAFGIDVGESCASVQGPFPPSMLASTSAPTAYDAAGAPGGPELYIGKDQFRETFCADVPADLARGHVGDAAAVVDRGADRERHCRRMEGQTILVPGVRARQRHPAGRRAVHGRADGRDH